MVQYQNFFLHPKPARGVGRRLVPFPNHQRFPPFLTVAAPAHGRFPLDEGASLDALMFLSGDPASDVVTVALGGNRMVLGNSVLEVRETLGNAASEETGRRGRSMEIGQSGMLLDSEKCPGENRRSLFRIRDFRIPFFCRSLHPPAGWGPSQSASLDPVPWLSPPIFRHPNPSAAADHFTGTGCWVCCSFWP